LNIFIYLYVFWGLFSLIFASYHYTIDVLAGCLITLTIWTIFHWYLEIPELRRRKIGRALWIFDHGGKKLCRHDRGIWKGEGGSWVDGVWIKDSDLLNRETLLNPSPLNPPLNEIVVPSNGNR